MLYDLNSTSRGSHTPKTMKHRNYHDIIGGIALVALGLAAAVYAQRYEFGELNRMGPGYFPVALGVILAVLGLLIAIPAFFQEGSPIHVDWAPLFVVMASLLIFALTLKSLGIIVATVLATLCASLVSEFSWRARLLLSLVIATLTYIVFILGLAMVLPAWPWS
jgi:hypothetical protein